MSKKVLGIPDRTVSTNPRQTSFEIWEGAIQHHYAERAGDHYDLRIGDPKTGIAHSWMIRSIPGPGEKVLAVKQPDHSLVYMDYKGKIKKGYGKGEVKRVFRDKIEILKSEPGKISFNLYKGKQTIRLHLIKTNFGWLLLNTTLTTKNRPDIPLKKPKYPSIKFTELSLENQNEIFSPKIDGAHNIISLKKGKPIEVSSYRPAKAKTGIIDHSFKTELYKIIPPPELDKTILRAELYGITPEGKAVKSTITSGILNSEVWKARAQKNKIDNILIDVIKYKGKDISKKPYSEKLKIMQEISDKISELKMPPLAKTSAEKALMVDSIAKKKNPLTEEGIVIYDLKKPIPLRAKIREDIDVYVKDVFPGKGRLQNKMIGGFYVSRTKGGPPLFRVGSGFSDELRREIFLHPEKFKDKLIKIYIQSEYPSGKVRVPIFKEFKEML